MMRPLLLAILYIYTSAAFAALTNGTVWEVRTAGSDTNGGAFNPAAAGTDMSQFDNKNAAGCSSCQSAAANLSVTNAVTNGTTTITSATATFTSALIGNLIYVSGGTGSVAANWYEVQTVPSGTSITVDRSTGLTAGTGVTLNIGGAFATPGNVGPIITNNTLTGTAYVKAGTYTITTGTCGAAGPWCTANQAVKLIGYQTTRTDLGTAPTFRLNAGVTATTVVTIRNSFLVNVTVDCNSQTTSTGVDTLIGSLAGYKITVQNCTAQGVRGNQGNGPVTYTLLAVTNSGNGTVSTGATTIDCYYCYFSSNNAAGCSSCNVSFSISANNTGSNGYGFATSNADHSVAYGNAQSGFTTAPNGGLITDCIAEGNTGAGIALTAAAIAHTNGTYNNAGGSITGGLVNTGHYTGSSSFFVNAAAGNFALNSTANAGALLRGTGAPVAWPSLATTSTTHSIGAAQLAAAAAFGSASIF